MPGMRPEVPVIQEVPVRPNHELVCVCIEGLSVAGGQ